MKPNPTKALGALVCAAFLFSASVASAAGSYATGQYRNLFSELLGHSEDELEAKIQTAWNQLFYGSDSTQRIYYPVGEDMAYLADIGNGDVRSEGMSYGMMIAVQLNRQAEFDRLWKWAKTYMYQSGGPQRGYFAWHCSFNGTKLSEGPASDGEEWFVTALLFADARWGSRSGIFNYSAEAQGILHTMLHKAEENQAPVTNMFDLAAKQVVFVPYGQSASFTDPSYHLPAFYELWADWATEDQTFWAEAAATSRAHFRAAAHPTTGLMPDYANFDGTPRVQGDHEDFRFDAWRTLANVAIDHAWFAADPWQVEQSDRVLGFLATYWPNVPNQFELAGTPLSASGSLGLYAMGAVAGLAADPDVARPWVERLWNSNPPTGTWRYYDGCLYFLALLQAGGRFRIHTPQDHDSRALNLSTRAHCGAGDDVLIPGFVIGGSGTKKLLIRAVGPTLGVDPFNIAGVLPDPRLQLKRLVDGAYQDIDSNDDWGSNSNVAGIRAAAARVWAFALGEGSADAALLVDLPAGQYTAVASDADTAATGIAIVEFWDADETPGAARLTNLSNRGRVGVGDSIMIPGIIVSDERPKTLLIRGVGPALVPAPFSIAGALADPKITLYRNVDDGPDEVVLECDNWGEAGDADAIARVAQQVFAFALDAGSLDAAVVVTLPPGAYTVHVSGVANATGVALAEVYEVR